MLKNTSNPHIKFCDTKNEYVVFDETSANVIATTALIREAKLALTEYAESLEEPKFTIAQLHTYIEFKLASMGVEDEYDRGWKDALKDIQSKLKLVK